MLGLLTLLVSACASRAVPEQADEPVPTEPAADGPPSASAPPHGASEHASQPDPALLALRDSLLQRIEQVETAAVACTQPSVQEIVGMAIDQARAADETCKSCEGVDRCADCKDLYTRALSLLDSLHSDLQDCPEAGIR